MRTWLADLALVLTSSLLLAACASDMGGPEGREGPPGRGPGAPGMGQSPAGAGGGWKEYDLNGDGKVTRAEFSAVRNLCFVRLDANGDGLLTRAEILRSRGVQPGASGDAMPSRPGPAGEGDIDRQEFDRAADSLWRILDTNGDGVVAGMELNGLSAAAQGDVCQSSGSSPSRGEGPGGAGPRGGQGPGGRR